MTPLMDHRAVETALDWSALIAHLRDWIAADQVEAPERQVCAIAQPDGTEASLLIMPAWVPGQAIGLKAVTFFPANPARGLATINASYMAFDGETGQLRAVMDGDALTARRTAAASALAAGYLARQDARTHLIVGTGQLAVSVAQAHAQVRDYEEHLIWGRTAAKAEALARELVQGGLRATAVSDLQQACARADVISTITASTKPLVLGEWLRPGSHLDLIGAFRPDMRESDDQAIAGATLFVDTVEGAVKSGDLHAPLRSGAITAGSIKADLKALCQGLHPGRSRADERTVFKSVGMSLEDLAAADLVLHSPARSTDSA